MTEKFTRKLKNKKAAMRSIHYSLNDVLIGTSYIAAV